MTSRADSDCEFRDEWFAGQDVNTWSSLAYVVVGAVMVVVVIRRRLPRAFYALAVAIAIEGIGSALYHGGTGDLAQYLHDVPLGAAAGFVAGWQVARMPWPGQGWEGRGALVGWAGGAVACAVGAAYGATNLAVAVITVVIVASDLFTRRRGLTPVWTGSLIALAALAAGMWFLGRSGSPLCFDQSWLQPHGGWHVLSALLLLAWMDRAAEVGSDDARPRAR